MQTLIYSLTSGGLIFLAFLVYTDPRQVNVLGNRWLGVFLISLFLLLIDEVLYEFKIYNQYPQLIGFESFTIFLMAPALYLSVSHFVSLDKKFKFIELLHFLPTAIFFPFALSGIFMSSSEKLKLLALPIEKPNPSDEVIIYFLWLQIIIYLALGLKKIAIHQKNINLFASNTQKINLNWLKYIIVSLSVMLAFWILEFFAFENKTFAKLATISYFFGSYFMGFFALRQEEIFPYKNKEIDELKTVFSIQSDLKTKRLPEEEIAFLKLKLIELMATEKLYLEENLSLPKLASKMNLSAHNLSFLINEGFGENFFQFVNRYRVEEAKRLLLSPRYEQLSMIGIAFESGFSSKTTFNTSFKKITGFSPSEYIAKPLLERNPSKYD
jgi:AraC-like DNA-binding protein